MSSPSRDFDLKSYSILNKLGEGGFANVYRIKDEKTNTYYAAKVSKIMVNEENQESDEVITLYREVNLMSMLNHPSIIKFIGYSTINFDGDPFPTFITELASRGSLRDIISMQSVGFPPEYWDDTKKLISIYGIAAGMLYLHSHNILHRDLKPENILMDEDYHPKISDFGLSKITDFLSISMNVQSQKGRAKGTPLYMSPEIHFEELYSKAGDVYSFAFIVYEIMTGQVPFKDLKPLKLMKKISQGDRPEIREDLPNAYKELIENCWAQDPNDRPSFESIVDDLRNNSEFVTDLMDEVEFEDYVCFIDSFKTTFDVTKKAISFSDFIKNKGKGNNKTKITESKKVQEVPEKVQEVPEKVQEVPEKVQEVPEKVQEVPEKVQDVPEKVQDVPEKVKKVSTPTKGINSVLPKVSGSNETYKFYCSGCNEDFLLRGVDVGIDVTMNCNQIKETLLKLINEKVNIKDKKLLLYFAGGVPFTVGNLVTFMSAKGLNPQKVIYGVLIKRTSDSSLNMLYPELCKFDIYIELGSFHDSTERGVAQMACLLGYLNHGGIKGDLLLRTCATLIHFPPLITSMSRIIDNNRVAGRDIATVWSTLFTYFRIFIPNKIDDRQVFEYTLKMCNLISHINDPPDRLPIMKFDIKPDNENTKFLYDLKVGKDVYFWKGDLYEYFPWSELNIKDFDEIEDSYKLINSFTPIFPMSIINETICRIVKGRYHEYLYIMPSPLKDENSLNSAIIIDPATGFSQTVDIEEFARRQSKYQLAEELIEPHQVKQIIMVNIDDSKAMIGDIAGYYIPKRSDKDHRITIAFQYLTTFINRIKYLSTVQGLISCNNTIRLRYPLTPFTSNFEQALMKIYLDGVKTIWDSLLRSIEEIVKFKYNENYKNAVSRILVIGSGDEQRVHDVTSIAKVHDVVKELLKNKIIVDSVIINSDDEGKMLCAVSHATGGLSFQIKDVNKGLELFEQTAFLDYGERHIEMHPLIPGNKNSSPNFLKPEMITEEFMNKARDNSVYDEIVINKLNKNITDNDKLDTARKCIFSNRDTIVPHPKLRRILKELHFAADINESESLNYDPDMKIFTIKSKIDEWIVFINGEKGTPYENKWWKLFVTFPDLYPLQPPEIRFLTVPYHINVSSDGKICLNSLGKGYFDTAKVINILQEIKGLLIIPDRKLAIRMDAFSLFLTDPNQYEKLARESTYNVAMNLNDYIKNYAIDDKVSDDFDVSFHENTPIYAISQITGKIIKKDKMIKASTGVLYDVDELRQLVASSKNPICVITGKELYERPEDLYSDDDFNI